MAKLGYYLYCIADIDQDRKVLGKGGVENANASLFTVNRRALSAVVSEAAIKQYKPRRKNNLMHQNNILRVMEHHSVLPFRFGVVADSLASIESLLDDNYEHFKSQLTHVKDRVEIGLKIRFFDMQKTIASIGQEDKDILALKKQATGRTPDRDLMIHTGQVIEQKLHEMIGAYKKRIHDVIKTHAIDCVINENTEQDMVYNGGFLVDKDQQEAFDEAVYAMDAKWPGLFSYKIIGPFPPYSFVKL